MISETSITNNNNKTQIESWDQQKKQLKPTWFSILYTFVMHVQQLHVVAAAAAAIVVVVFSLKNNFSIKKNHNIILYNNNNMKQQK